MKNIVVIPAKGTSNRLPNKNLKYLGEFSLVRHSVNYALNNFKIIDQIIVSSDSDLILEEVKLPNVTGLIRPDELSSDSASTVSVLKHVVKYFELDDEDNIILLQPTNPLRPLNLFKEALNLFNSNDCDSLMTVSRSYDKLGSIKNNKFVPYNYFQGQRSQDLKPLYKENGLLYITKVKLIKEGEILGLNNYPLIINHPFASVDIDTIEDFNYANFILNYYDE